MADVVKPTRSYDSPRRREQAAATRGEILGAAQRLFEREGYAATSVAAIATAAGVSTKTVYLAFETKSGLLRAAWNVLLRGDDERSPVGERPWYREVLDEPDAARKLRLNARNSTFVRRRAGAMLEVLRAAAPTDPEIDALWQRIQAEFRDNQRAIVVSLRDLGALRPDLDVERATDILWTVNHPSVYWLLTGERGWSHEDYEAWLGDTFCSQLLAAPA